MAKPYALNVKTLGSTPSLPEIIYNLQKIHIKLFY